MTARGSPFTPFPATGPTEIPPCPARNERFPSLRSVLAGSFSKKLGRQKQPAKLDTLLHSPPH